MKLFSLFTTMVASNPLTMMLMADQFEDDTTKLMFMMNSMVRD